jgi:hypothetical protein
MGIITSNNEKKIMGIHYTYKAQKGERSLKKQQKQMDRQRRSHNRKLLKQQKNNKSDFSVDVDTIITMDMLTDPKRNGQV